MMFTGMRISECNTIKKKNLHLSENYLVTGFEENARKNKKPLYFCFPKEIALLLQEFLLDDNGSEWVFRGRIKNKNTYLTVASIMILCERMSKELGFKILSHSFRRTLITRLLHESKCPTHIVETITNHEISAIIFKNYDQYSIELRKKDYFEYLPQSYKKILDYLSNL